MKKLLIIPFILICFATGLSGQGLSDEQVSEYLKYVAHGRVAEVKIKLPDLLAQYPADPGVKLLHAVVIDDADKALEIYVAIIRNNPQSRWADDAYWRIIQYHAITGNIEKAKFELDNFRKRYPASDYLGPATDVVRSAERIKHIRYEKAAAIAEAKETPDTRDKTAELKKVYEEVPPVDPEDKIYEVKAVPKSVEDVPSSDDNSSFDDGKIKFGLQVGVYREMQRAETERDKYLAKRMRTEIIQREINGDILHAVVIGNYTTPERAESAKKIVKRECNCQPILIEKPRK